MSAFHQLKEIGFKLIHALDTHEEIRNAQSLSEFFSAFTHQHGLSVFGNQESHVSGGVALSVFDASVCLDDHLRTARFIKGTYLAILEARNRFPGQPIHILYAGCGPYATLLLPILPLFDPADLDLLLLDIHQESIQSVGKLLQAVELESYSVQTVCGDATSYKIPEAWPMHILVTETMFHALIREPQVAITANLVPQLMSGGILIPEEIHIDLVYTFFGKEPYKHTMDNGRAHRLSYPERCQVQRLFSINKERSFFKHAQINHRQFESAYFPILGSISDCPDLCIFTTLTVFKNLSLDLADSYITNPFCITSFSGFPEGAYFKVIYDFDAIPTWTYRIKG